MAHCFLIADDEENDIFLIRLALERAQLAVDLLVANDGAQAVELLARLDAGQPEKLPAVFLLDLKMPLLNGFDVLAWMAANDYLQRLPVVVLTSSSREDDRERAKAAGAREYFVKPSSIADLAALLTDLHRRYAATRPIGSSCLPPTCQDAPS